MACISGTLGKRDKRPPFDQSKHHETSNDDATTKLTAKDIQRRRKGRGGCAERGVSGVLGNSRENMHHLRVGPVISRGEILNKWRLTDPSVESLTFKAFTIPDTHPSQSSLALGLTPSPNL